MRTIVIIGAIILAGAATVAVVQNNKPDSAPAFQQGPAPVSESGEPLLNPEHGLPGHRCDLPVGAPLKTSAGAAAPAVLPQPSNQPAPAGVKTNPAHGLPGHRCDLPVGAPLS